MRTKVKIKKVYLVENEACTIETMFSSLKRAKEFLKEVAAEVEAEIEEKVEWSDDGERFDVDRQWSEHRAWIKTFYVR